MLYSEDDAGLSIKVGIDEELASQGVVSSRIISLPFTAANASSVVTTALAQNPKVVLLSANLQLQLLFKKVQQFLLVC